MTKRKTPAKPTTHTIAARLPAELAEALDAQAAAAGLTVTQVIIGLVRGYVDGRFIVALHVGASEPPATR
ncbi:MAG: hypothetical protein HZB53_20070 [Chloroflexi bacterium]|nr:hypothetical protein [Chloroflexota bacterium]